jgi:hypothetical protein
LLQKCQGFVGRNAVHPRIELAVALKLVDIPVDLDKSVLEYIVRIVMIEYNPSDMPIQTFFVSVYQHLKGFCTAGFLLELLDQSFLSDQYSYGLMLRLRYKEKV